MMTFGCHLLFGQTRRGRLGNQLAVLYSHCFCGVNPGGCSGDPCKLQRSARTFIEKAGSAEGQGSSQMFSTCCNLSVQFVNNSFFFLILRLCSRYYCVGSRK